MRTKPQTALERAGIEWDYEGYLFCNEPVRFADTGEVATKDELLRTKANADRELTLSESQKQMLQVGQVRRPIRVALFRQQYLLLKKTGWKTACDRHDAFYSVDQPLSRCEMDLYL